MIGAGAGAGLLQTLVQTCDDLGVKTWRRVVEWLTTSPVSTGFAADESTPRPIDQLIGEMLGVYGDKPVTREQALSVAAVMRGRNLLCSPATLPLTQYGPDGTIVPSRLLAQIDPNVANVVTLAQTFEDLICEAIAWWEITEFGADGFPVHARRVAPGLVSLDPPAGRSPSPLPSGVDPRDRQTVWLDGREVPIGNVIRFDSPNPGLLRYPRPVRRAMLIDQAAAMYAEDPRPLDFFTPADGVDPADDDKIREILRDWRRARRARSTGYVPAALKYNTVDQPSPADLQLAELQRAASLDIANMLGIDPEELGVSTTSRTYSNNVDRRRDRINDVHAPYLRAITDRLSMNDVTRRGYKITFDLSDYLKSNPTERWAMYDKAVALGVIVDPATEIRALEGWAPLPAGTRPALRALPGGRAPGRPVAGGDQVAAAGGGPGHTFTAGPGADLTLEFGSTSHAFAVDVERRTIRGRAVPYGAVAKKYGLSYRFKPGSLKYADASRIKLLRDHDPRQPLGYAQSITESADGADVVFKIARGAAGDEALSLAADRVLDGLSIGVDFDLLADALRADDGVYDVHRADWRETSLLAIPAFDDARVTKVAAGRTTGGGPMGDDQTNPGHAPAAPAAPATGPAALDFGALLQTPGVAAALAAHLAAATAPAAAPEVRAVVNPHQPGAPAGGGVALVNEPAPYRFDRKGNLLPAAHDFSSDIFEGWKHGGGGDQAARDRAESWLREQFAVTPANVTALNPARNRPDLYVDQMQYAYPIWDAIDSGSLTDITPFVVPKFNSATGLVADHTTGTEPTPGAFTATAQTITPTPVSGKVEITREAWDQGGNPAMSGLIWRQMTRGYFEALEAYAVAQLVAQAASIADITIGTAGAADSVLDQALAAAFVPLRYVRGGFRFRKSFTQVDLYTKLAAAKDSAGRPLYPSIGPQNAAGTQADDFGTIHARGVDFIPAWATAATSANAASSYLLDPESVHGWASQPSRIDLSWRVAWVDVGIWGYKAFAITDTAGARELLYDPTP